MKPDKMKSTSDKVANIMIIAMVLAGTVLFAFVNRASQDGELMSKLFLLFFGAIITIQIVPGLILLGSMIKGLVSLGRKPEEAEVTAENESRK
ncbi:MAG TPA: hypothetical protein VGJ93_14370 [Desulfuromonadaceae bacterium]|jgi:nitrate reductase gamma subunit